MRDLSPEHRVLLQIARGEPGQLSENLNRDFLIAEANRHGMMPQLRLDDEWYRANARKNFIATNSAVRAVDILSGGNVSAIVFKGPALAQELYGDFTLRQYIDIDILVRVDDFEPAIELLKRTGYRALYNVREDLERRLIRSSNVFGCRDSSGVHIELHRDFFPAKYRLPINSEKLWETVHCVSLLGRPVRTLPHEWNLLELGLHSLKHHYFKLEWFASVDRLSRAYNGVQGLTRELARSLNCAPLFELSLEITKSVLAGFRTRDKLHQRVFHSVWSPPGTMSPFEFCRFVWSLPRDIRSKLSISAATVFEPTSLEFEEPSLPRLLNSLYPLMRLVRLSRKYMTKSNM